MPWLWGQGRSWAGNEVPRGDRWWPHTTRPASGRQRDEAAGSGAGGCGISARARWLSGHLNAGPCCLLRAWLQGEVPTCHGMLGSEDTELSQAWDLAFGWGHGEHGAGLPSACPLPPPTSITVSLRAGGKNISGQHGAEAGLGASGSRRKDLRGQPRRTAPPLCVPLPAPAPLPSRPAHL